MRRDSLLPMLPVIVLTIIALKATGSVKYPGEPPKYVNVDPTTISIAYKTVGPLPLPYQAARVRGSLHNVGGKRLGPIRPVDEIALMLAVKASEDSEFRPPGRYALLHDRGKRTTSGSPRGRLNHQAPTELAPREQSGTSFTLAATWDYRAGWYFDATPIFSLPGEYTFKFAYPLEYKDREHFPGSKTYYGVPVYLESLLSITVQEPRGDDKTIGEWLAKHADLAEAMMSPVHEPAAGAIPRLKEIIERFPNSSYVPYARFALARSYLQGIELRVNKVPQADRDAAIKQLEQTVGYDFAYQPNALILLRRALGDSNPARIKQIDLAMDNNYPDALEWLDAVAPTMTPEEWKLFRTRHPGDKLLATGADLDRNPDVSLARPNQAGLWWLSSILVILVASTIGACWMLWNTGARNDRSKE